MLLNFPVVPSYYSRLPQTLGFTTHRCRQKYFQRRLAIAYIGYGTINLGWGVSHGSYTNATRRFVKAVCGVYGNQIRWPTDIPELPPLFLMDLRTQSICLALVVCLVWSVLWMERMW